MKIFCRSCRAFTCVSTEPSDRLRSHSDNALAETTIGLSKTECVRDGSPFRRGLIATLADLEEITSAWVHW